MSPQEWQSIEDIYEAEFGRKMRGNRWLNRFINLDYHQVEHALMVCGEVANTAPTILDIVKHLPKGLVQTARPDHIHVWSEWALRWDEDGKVLAKMRVCDTCGRHDKQRCKCERCHCRHLGAVRITPQWYYCEVCDGTIRARDDDAYLESRDPVQHANGLDIPS